MFAYKLFKLSGSYLLLFTIEKNTIIVTNNFIYRFPKVLDHFAYVICFTSHLNLLVFKQFFIPNLTLRQLFTTHTRVFLSIESFLFMLSFEVFLHPNHFLKQKLQVSTTRWRWLRESWVRFLREKLQLTIWVTLNEVGAKFLQLAFYFVKFFSNKAQM